MRLKFRLSIRHRTAAAENAPRLEGRLPAGNHFVYEGFVGPAAAPGALRHSHISRGCLASAKRLTQADIAGLDPAIHASSRFLTWLERFGAAAAWALGTSPRVTSGVGGGGLRVPQTMCESRRGGRSGRSGRSGRAAPGA